MKLALYYHPHIDSLYYFDAKNVLWKVTDRGTKFYSNFNTEIGVFESEAIFIGLI